MTYNKNRVTEDSQWMVWESQPVCLSLPLKIRYEIIVLTALNSYLNALLSVSNMQASQMQNIGLAYREHGKLALQW